MINGNSYQALTHNGITQLYSETFDRQEFILQIIQVFTLKEDTFSIFLSDGFTWIKGALIQEAKTEAIKLNLASYTVIKFLAEDIQTTSGAQPTFKLRKFEIISTKIHNVIGEPVPFNDYNKKKEFINFESGNMISSKRNVSLRQVKQMPAGKISASILAKVVKRPDKINTVMNIRIEDEEKEEIQCCFFGESVAKYKDMLNQGQWYRFEDPVLQVNNRYGNMLQLKINNQSKVVKQKKSSEVKPGIIHHNNNHSYKAESQKKIKESQPLKEFVLKDYEGKDSIEEYDTFVIARPLKIFTMKNNMGRNYECVNQFGQIFEILLWNDCSLEVNIGQTYKFEYMKVKVFKERLSLQSQRGKTQIIPSKVIVLSREEYFGGGRNSLYIPQKQRFLGSNDIIYSITEMIQKSEKSKEKSIFILCCGYLTIKFDYIGSNSFDGYSELRRKLFYVHCQKCENNEYLRSKIELENMNGKVVCNSCKSQTVRILWNIKTSLMDSQTEIACKINSQIAEKLIQMTPFEGMLLYLENHQNLKHIMQKKLNFRRGVFKFSSKLNQKRQGERFYNICQYYQDGNKIFAQRSINELKRAFTSFIKFRNWPDADKMPNSMENEDNPEHHHEIRNQRLHEEKEQIQEVPQNQQIEIQK